MTFKDLHKIISDQKKAIEVQSKIHDPSHYWEGKKVIPSSEWRKIANSSKAYGGQYQKTEEALQYFPDDYMQVLFPFGVQQGLEEQVNKWYSDYLELMEYKKNPNYGKTKCFRCLLSPDREEAAIFVGINKVISRALDTDSVSVYPCKVLNRFACPYDKKSDNYAIEDEKPDVDYLFHLSEMAFAVELALAKATEEDSIFRIRSVEDVYHALTDKGTLEKILEQGLKEKHRRYKYKIIDFLVNMKDRIKLEDLTFYPSAM